MNALYLKFKNLKKLHKSGKFKTDDYLQYMKTFERVQLVPVHFKLTPCYEEYLEELESYLRSFFQKS